MSKNKVAFVCTECGYEYTKWQGQCSACQTWDSIKELRLGAASKRQDQRFQGFAGQTGSVQLLKDVAIQQTQRFSSGIAEFDRVLGGGFVPGSAVLLGGSPGAGKSTILLQIMCHAAQNRAALYITGEESLEQVATRAQRLRLPTDKLNMLAETSVEQILAVAAEQKPSIIVIDSIQVMYTETVDAAPGGVSQVRESAAALTRFAKQTNTVILFVGHVTKDQSLAGPMILTHLIDASIMLANTDDARYRMMRTTKNRFGPVNELGVFAMTETGMKEVKNPSAIFLSRGEPSPGSLVNVLWEGTRPLMVEIQALVDTCQFGNPRRVAVGLDQNRLAMLLAVLHKHGGLHVADQDVFLNVVGGVKVTETSADLAMLLAVVSSFRNQTLPHDLCVFGECGLSGEIRPCAHGQERIQEAYKHGFKKAIVPKMNLSKQKLADFQVIGVSCLTEALDAVEQFSEH